MFIRYFARTDDHALGRVAAAYCDVLVATGIPVRLVSTRVAELQTDARGRCSSAWGRHRDLLATPMVGFFANVVCSDFTDWLRFWTNGRMNVLLLAEQNLEPRNAQPDLIEAAQKYDYIYAPSTDVADVMERVTGLRPIVLPIETERSAQHLHAIFQGAR